MSLFDRLFWPLVSDNRGWNLMCKCGSVHSDMNYKKAIQKVKKCKHKPRKDGV